MDAQRFPPPDNLRQTSELSERLAALLWARYPIKDADNPGSLPGGAVDPVLLSLLLKQLRDALSAEPPSWKDDPALDGFRRIEGAGVSYGWAAEVSEERARMSRLVWSLQRELRRRQHDPRLPPLILPPRICDALRHSAGVLARHAEADGATSPPIGTARGKPEKRDKGPIIIAALALHHGYNLGKVKTRDPAKMSALARSIGVDRSTVCRFFKHGPGGKVFGSHDGYCDSCKNGTIGKALQELQGDRPPIPRKRRSDRRRPLPGPH